MSGISDIKQKESKPRGIAMQRREFIGQRVKRKEDPRFLRGEGNYVGDIQLHGMVHAALLRSPHAHAWIRAVNTQEALRIPGVLSVITFQDISHLAKPIPTRLASHPSFVHYLQYPLAKEKVRYVGEPVAVVVADSRYVAEDALECIQTDYEPLPAVVNTRSAVKADAVRVHEQTAGNLAGCGVVDLGDVEGAFRRAELSFSEQFTIQRHTGMPMETRGLIAEYNRGTKVLTVWGPTKVPYFNRSVLATFLGLPEHGIHFIEPDVGGGFGVRGEFYPEDFLIPFLALRLDRPVKWIEDRREHFLATNHSREQRWEVEVAAGKEGDLQAVKARIWNDMGAYIRGSTIPALAAGVFPGPYRLPNYWCEWNAVITNKTPVGTYRAPSRYESNFVRERLMDLISSRLGLDPAAVRFRNFIQPQEMPYSVGTSVLTTPIVYDSGDYPRLMRKAVELSDYGRLRKEQASRRAEGKYVGIGLACFVEKTGTGPFEAVRVRMDRSGKAVVYTGATSVGQGLETTLAQICAGELGLGIDDVTVVHGDTSLAPHSTGTFASRVTVMGGNAVLLAARKLREKVIRLAAEYFGCSEEEVRFEGSTLSAKSGRREALSLGELMRHASDSWKWGVSGLDLEATHYFEAKHMTYPHGAQVALVEVDAGTGVVTVKKLWSLYDVGRAVNPMLLEGQIVGGVAQGLGGAFLEELAYDEAGQLLSTSFMDYLLPSSMEMPPGEVHLFENDPSPLNPLGLKGGGEGGTAGVGAAIANAVSDALKPLDIQITSLPLSPNKLMDLISKSRRMNESPREA